jgi:single-stranded-DNA-specific exonuclease
MTSLTARTARGEDLPTEAMDYRWKLSPPPDEAKVRKIVEALAVPNPIAAILVNRGIDTFEQARDYFRPSLNLLHDPFLMDGMDLAVGRVRDAIEKHETILVFGDYDVDGTNGAAMLYLVLKSLGANVVVHIPDRFKEGYGISKYGIDQAHELKATLLLAVDCGVTAVDQVDYARSLGIDVIICDHHEPSEKIPNAQAVLDPLKPSCPYPFKYLSGCGVAFKLLQGLARSYGREDLPYDYLDFVSLASTADIVPLIDENRTLVKLGLDQINLNPRPGIRALIERSGLKLGQLNTGQVVFVLAPRINAVGRLGAASRAVELLTCTDEATARELALVLEGENQNRRKIDEETFTHAQQLVEQYLDLENDAAIVLHQETWHPGVIGIVASRLVEKYYKPTVMLTTVDGVVKGSARSVAGFDIYQALKKVEDKLLQFGGHKYAAGLAVEADRLDEFRDAFNTVVKELLPDELRTPELRIDLHLDLKDITPKFIRLLKQFAPFGPQNMRPTFLSDDVEVVGSGRIVGKNHLRFKVRQDGVVLDVIGFNLGNFLTQLAPMRKDLRLVYSVEESEWNGETFPQLKAKDLKYGVEA